MQICPTCGGNGHIRSQSSVALHVLRGVEEHLLKNTTHDIIVRTTADTALYMLNHKRDTVVDLGCGTGLAGSAFVDLANTLIGIDVSKAMVAQAAAKGVYDQLLVDDVVDGLAQIDGQIELFICTDVFIYVGNMEPTFAAVRDGKCVV